MTKKNDQERPFPAAVYVPAETTRMIAKRIARLPASKRTERRFIIIKAGRYRIATDQVVLYQHQANLVSCLKADFLGKKICAVVDIFAPEKLIMDAPLDDDGLFLKFMREHWDESLESDSVVTMLYCCNLRGALVDYYVDLVEFHERLPKFGQE